jgi:hypothetical protein
MYESGHHRAGHHAADRYALARLDRRWSEDERARIEFQLRRLFPDFDERGGSVRIGSSPRARRQRGRWIRIQFQAPLRRDERYELISWLEAQDRRIDH